MCFSVLVKCIFVLIDNKSTHWIKVRAGLLTEPPDLFLGHPWRIIYNWTRECLWRISSGLSRTCVKIAKKLITLRIKHKMNGRLLQGIIKMCNDLWTNLIKFIYITYLSDLPLKKTNIRQLARDQVMQLCKWYLSLRVSFFC